MSTLPIFFLLCGVVLISALPEAIPHPESDVAVEPPKAEEEAGDVAAGGGVGGRVRRQYSGYLGGSGSSSSSEEEGYQRFQGGQEGRDVISGMKYSEATEHYWMYWEKECSRRGYAMPRSARWSGIG